MKTASKHPTTILLNGSPSSFYPGHSFIRRLDNFVAANPNLNHQFLLNNVATCKLRGVRGRTVAKTLQYDLPVVASSAPDIVILQLGTNDLSRLDPLVVASSIEELVTILHDTYNVKLANTSGIRSCIQRAVRALNKYAKTFLKVLPYVFFWGHRGFWNASQRFLARVVVSKKLFDFGLFYPCRSPRAFLQEEIITLKRMRSQYNPTNLGDMIFNYLSNPGTNNVHYITYKY